jgi:DNA-directed RNA polymerase subunit RPC12/RpoP
MGKSKTTWYCNRCECKFELMLDEDFFGKLEDDETARCPYCGSFDTRKL